MAKQRKLLSARTPPESTRTDSIDLESTRSLGRAIGALQRELDTAIQRFNEYTAKRRAALRRAPARRRRSRSGASTRAAHAADAPTRRTRTARRTSTSADDGSTAASANSTTGSTAKRRSRPK